jgi:hypothetical protein
MDEMEEVGAGGRRRSRGGGGRGWAEEGPRWRWAAAEEPRFERIERFLVRKDKVPTVGLHES